VALVVRFTCIYAYLVFNMLTTRLLFTSFIEIKKKHKLWIVEPLTFSLTLLEVKFLPPLVNLPEFAECGELHIRLKRPAGIGEHVITVR